MQDRVSQYPGRVKLTPVPGQENVYDMEWADGATVAGTPLNKANLLTDETAALFGLGADAVPDDMFRALTHRRLVRSFIFSKIEEMKFLESDYGKTFVIVPDFSSVPSAQNFTVEPCVTNNTSGSVSQSGVSGFCLKSDGTVSARTRVTSVATPGAEIRVHVLKNFGTNKPYILAEGVDRSSSAALVNTITFSSIVSTSSETADVIKIYGAIGMKLSIYEEIYGGT